MIEVEAFLVGLVGALVAVYILQDSRRIHHPFKLFAFFAALIFFALDTAAGPATLSRHVLAGAIELTALGLLFVGEAKKLSGERETQKPALGRVQSAECTGGFEPAC